MNQLLTFLTYQYLQIKRAVHKLPVLLCGIILLTGFIGSITYCSMSIYTHSMEQGLLSSPLQIDLVLQDTSDDTALAMQFIQNMESTRNILSFQVTSMEQAYEDLDSKKAVAVMILPPGILNSILDGTNQPVQILFPSSSDLSTLIVQELTNAGAIMLDAAQSGIYTLTDLYISHNLHSYLEDSYQHLNQINLSHALTRDRLFFSRNATMLGDFSLFAYYVSSAVWLILLLFGILCAPFLSRESDSLTHKLHQAGITKPFLILSRWLTAICMYTVLFLVPFLIYSVGFSQGTSYQITFSSLGYYILCLAFTASYVVMFYELTPNAATGILCITICSLILLFLSGAFIPIAFFPDTLKEVSHMLPTSYALQSTRILMSTRNIDFQVLSPMILYTLVFLSIPNIIGRKSQPS